MVRNVCPCVLLHLVTSPMWLCLPQDVEAAKNLSETTQSAVSQLAATLLSDAVPGERPISIHVSTDNPTFRSNVTDACRDLGIRIPTAYRVPA
jgi:hypothetical protein